MLNSSCCPLERISQTAYINGTGVGEGRALKPIQTGERKMPLGHFRYSVHGKRPKEREAVDEQIANVELK